MECVIPTQRLLIIGAGGHAISVADAAIAAGFQVVGFAVTQGRPREFSISGLPVTSGLPAGFRNSDQMFTVAIGDNWTRSRVWSELSQTLGADRSPAVIHPSASVSASASISQGSVVLQAATIGALVSVEIGCIVNSAAAVDHQSVLREFSSVGPGATLGGQAELGPRSAVGIGSTLKHGISIGQDSVVGAASYVHDSLPDQVVAFGVPAVVRARRSPDQPYLA